MRFSAVAHSVCGCLTAIAFSLGGASAADDMSVAGKWTGTQVGRGGSTVALEFNIAQSGQSLSGTVFVRGRPTQMPKDYDITIVGKVEGRSVVLEYWNPESRKNVLTLTLGTDGKTLIGPGRVEGTQASGQITLSKVAD